MNNFTNFLVLICCTILCSGYDLFRCPVPSEWRFRSEYICRNTSKPHYYCMIDGNNNDIYKEFCRNKNDFEGAGRQFVFKGINPDGQDCFDDRYQPILFWTNGSSECIFQKSKCQGDGLFVLSNGTTSTDITCRCDHKQGYAFVSKPENPCFCVPSQEDCSCYRKHCKSTEKLSPNYTCIPYGEQPTTLCHASHESGFVEIQRPTLKNVSDTKNNLVSFKMGHNKSRYDAKTAVLILSVIFVIIGVIGFLFILCGAPHQDCVKMDYCAIEGNAVQMEFRVVSFLPVEFEIVTANGVSHHINPTRVDGKKKYCSFAVENPQKSDSGIFTCYASNIFGTEKLKTELYVKASPKLVLHVHECMQPDGMEDDVMLECEVQSDKIAIESVIWRKHVDETKTDIEPGNNTDKYTVGTPDMPSLTIHHVDKNDKGSYVSEVKHKFGTTESEPIVLASPKLVLHVHECMQPDGMEDDVMLECEVQSDKIAIESVIWRKHVDETKTDIEPGNNTDKYTVGTPDMPSLTIHHVDKNDKGSYVCEVKHKFGTTESEPIVLASPKLVLHVHECMQPDGMEDDVMLECEVQSDKIAIESVIWRKHVDETKTDIEPGNNTDKYTVGTPDMPSLTIHHVDKNDKGSYVCEVKHKFGTTESEPIVLASPKLVLHVHECVQPDGMEDDVMLECEVQSDNIAIESVIWRKHVDETKTDIEPGNNTDKYTVGTPDMPSLTIHHVDNNDKGSYVCEVKHMFGTTESEPIVLGPPVINEDILYQENLKRMKLVCGVRSNTKIYSARWTHRTSSGVVDISPNPSIGKYTGSTVEDPSLTILKPDSDDAGTYTCIVSNKIGTSQSASLVVGRPEVTIDKLSYYAEVGNSTTIICKVRSSLPLTKITWERKTSDEETMVDLNDKAKFLGATPDNPSLTILNVDSSDMGQYICFAANPVGTVESPKITVTDVKALPEIQTEGESLYAEVGNKVEIKCKVNSNLPITKVTWKRKISDNAAEWVDLNDYTKFQGTTPDNPSLIISNVESCDFGSYICCVTNSVGTVESPTILLTKIKGNMKSHRTEPDEVINSDFKDSEFCSPRVFTMRGSIKERSEKNTDETDKGLNLQFAQVALTEARRKAQQILEEELRIVFVGKTGVGKSSTANTILGQNYFPCDPSFESVTTECMIAKTEYKEKTVQLIDTPGIFASNDDEKKTEEEIKRCIHLAAPGPHAILFVIKYDRFTKEDYECIETFLEYFGDELKKFVIVVFTHVDKMKETKTIKGMLEKAPKLNKFIKECGHRYCKFNNEGNNKEKEDQIGHLFEMISNLKTKNDFIYFHDESFLSAEKRVKELEISIREDCERKYLQKNEELQKQIEPTKATKATEKIEMITRQFKQKQEDLRKEFEKEIELVREKLRKEFEVQTFIEFPIRRNRQRRLQSL